MNKCGKCGADIQTNVKHCKACGNSSFDDKKARVMNQEKNWIKPGLIVAVVVVALVAGWMFKESGAGNRMAGATSFTPHRETSVRLSKAQPVTTEAGEVRIPVKNVNDGNAHFYSHSAGGKMITFFLMKAADGSIRTAFDACMACNHAKLGYRQEGDMVVCNNCGMGFSPSDIGRRSGGCNPIPIEKNGDGETIVLKIQDVEAGARYF